MANPKINGLILPRQRLADVYRQATRTGGPQDQRAANKTGESVENASFPTEKAEISAAAYRMMSLRRDVIAGRQALADEPDTRMDRVAEVKARLNQGYYRSQYVESTMAERLVQLMKDLEDI